ncbi:5-formyltetrahydrofolate cyclo-ligase [Anaerotruncus rubiinfantis]|uniref:5-formyltetrahydrofolate cyclo-ligase n=1 Tax=Anaerotruncus rubiinfantis TaxID=1720200 RepID=UPI0034A39923
MQRVDIRPLKQKLRREIKQWRREMPSEQKKLADGRILGRVTGLREYAECHTLLTYVSLPIEVDTIALILRALAEGKRVAVPRCVEGTREMEFYLIDSLSQLSPQAFGVLEPVREKCERLTDFSGSVCIVPALAYDLSGYRLGYGAGYYDRFLSQYPHPKIGVVYAENVKKALWHGRYDLPVGLIATDWGLIACQPRKNRRRKNDGSGG